MRKEIWRKGLVVIAVAVFLNLAIHSAISARNSMLPEMEEQKNKECKSYEETEVIEVEVTEYGENGLTESKTIELPKKVVNELRNRLIDAKGMEERFYILKEYGLISEKAMETWKKGMYQKAESMGLAKLEQQATATKYGKLGILNFPVMLNFLCKVNAIYILNGNAHLGFPPIAGLMKFFGSKILSFDIVDMCWGVLGILETKGLLRTHTLVAIPSFMCLAGFVGVHIHIPLVLDIYNGFSAMAFALGLGIHGIDFNLPSFALLGFIAGGLFMVVLNSLIAGGTQ